MYFIRNMKLECWRAEVTHTQWNMKLAVSFLPGLEPLEDVLKHVVRHEQHLVVVLVDGHFQVQARELACTKNVGNGHIRVRPQKHGLHARSVMVATV